MATDKKNEILTTYITDVHALVTHGLQAIHRQVENLKNVSHADARSAVSSFVTVLESQKRELEARIKALGGKSTQPVKDANRTTGRFLGTSRTSSAGICAAATSRGFARLRCDSCEQTRLVAFSCKGRGFCPSCLGRKMASTAAHLVEDVLPANVPLRQWGAHGAPFAWRKRLGYDGALLSALTRLFIKTVLDFYRERGGVGPRGQSGAVVAVQRTSSDLKLNPHVHAVFLDGLYRAPEKDGDELEFRALSHLSTRDVDGPQPRPRRSAT